MRSFRWLFITGGIVVVVLAVGIALGSVWLNSFIRSNAFRREMETRARQTLGSPVQIREIDFSVWSGVKLSGLATKLDSSHMGGQGALVVQVESVSCSYSLLELLHRRLQLDGLTLVQPQLVLTQQPASTVPTPEPPPVTDTGAAPSPAEAQSGKTSPFQFILESARIVDGSVAIRDATGATKADLQGVQISANTAGYYEGKEVTGTVRIADVALPQNLHLTDFSTPFIYRAGAVEAKPFEAAAFDGRLTGDYTLDATGPSLLEVNAVRLDVARIGEVANPGSSTRLSGSLAFQSKWHGVETGKLTGEGDAQITDGRLEGVGILQELAVALRVKEMSDPELKSVTTHFQVANGETHFSGLKIESTAFEMTGDGVIDAQGQLNANMVLTLQGDAMKGIPGEAAAFFSKLPGGGGSIPFHLSGSVAHPQADLTTRLFLQSSKVQKTISRALKHFFH